MVWLLLLLGLVFLIVLIARSSPARPQPRRRRDHGGSGVVLMDGAPLLGPDDVGLGLTQGAVIFDDEDADTRRFQPGGGSGGGAGASGSWNEDAGFIDDDDHGGWDAGDGDGGDD